MILKFFILSVGISPSNLHGVSRAHPFYKAVAAGKFVEKLLVPKWMLRGMKNLSLSLTSADLLSHLDQCRSEVAEPTEEPEGHQEPHKQLEAACNFGGMWAFSNIMVNFWGLAISGAQKNHGLKMILDDSSIDKLSILKLGSLDTYVFFN